jgi:hypothetical protein
LGSIFSSNGPRPSCSRGITEKGRPNFSNIHARCAARSLGSRPGQRPQQLVGSAAFAYSDYSSPPVVLRAVERKISIRRHHALSPVPGSLRSRVHLSGAMPASAGSGTCTLRRLHGAVPGTVRVKKLRADGRHQRSVVSVALIRAKAAICLGRKHQISRRYVPVLVHVSGLLVRGGPDITTKLTAAESVPAPLATAILHCRAHSLMQEYIYWPAITRRA